MIGYHLRTILARHAVEGVLPNGDNWKGLAMEVFKSAWWIENIRRSAFPERNDSPMEVSIFPSVYPTQCHICGKQYRPKGTSEWEHLNLAAADVMRQRTRCSWTWTAWAATLRDVVAFVACHCDSACLNDQEALALALAWPDK
jgi:hypothetical protein